MSASPAEPTGPDSPEVVIIGAGPAGLTAAYELVKRGATPVVLESDSVVGGISRTARADGWRFDIGGHRFFTKVASVEKLWHEILSDDEFLTRPRLSRMYYQGKYYDYPIKPFNALKNLGLIEATRCMLSYAWVKVHPPKNQDGLEGYIAADYGWRLYNHFFKTYNEKLWGVPASSISSDFAAQRIKGMSLIDALWEPLRAKIFGRRDKAGQVTSLIEEFQYPKYGPGMMWERCRELVEAGGAEVVMDTKVTAIRHHDGRATEVVAASADGESVRPADHVISSMPFPRLLQAMDPPVPDEVRGAAEALGFRDFLTVAVVIPEEAGFPDNWIYIHSPEVQVGRIQNFGSWSPYLVKDGRTCLGLEYFVFEGDETWSKPDDELIEQAKHELQVLGLVDPAVVESGYVVRMPKAYPVYDETYRANVAVLREWLETHTPNVHPVGRNGMHKYNNQDHSMYTAMLTVENIYGAHNDIWTVNVEEEYHETQSASDRAPESGTGRDRARDPSRRLPARPSPGRLHPPVTEPMLSGGPGEMAEMARAAGLRRVHVLAWRDLADVEAGGSEVHCAEVVRRWAEAGLEVTMRTSYAQGHPPEAVRDGYRVIRKHGRFMVFPTTVISEVLGRTGPTDGLVEYWNGTPYLSPIWSRTPHITVVHHVHKDMWRLVLDEKLAPWGEWIERRVAPPIYRRTALVTLSESSRRELIDYLHFSPDQITVVPPGIDHRFAPSGTRSATPLVVSVGRLMAPKRFDELIRVMAEVREQHPTVQLVIVGDGYERLALEQQISDLDAGHWVRLAGHASDAELLALYRRAWLITSASIAEGWGMTITEAAACGTPSVVTRINGHTDAVVDGQSGLLADSSRDLAQKIGAVIGDQDLRDRLSDGALKYAATLTWDATAMGVLTPLAQQALRRQLRSGERSRS